jgi:hypothetical protein
MKYVGLFVLPAAFVSCADALPSSPLTAAQMEGSSLDCPLAQRIVVDASVVVLNDATGIDFSGPKQAVDLVRAKVRAMKYANDSQGDAFAVCPCAYDAPEWQLAMQLPAFTQNSEFNFPRSEETSWPPPATPVAAEASIHETPRGALLLLRPKDPTLHHSLSARVRAGVEAMQTSCMSPL